jgi:integrase
VAQGQQERKEATVSIYKRGEVYWYKFMWHGKLIRESTKQGNNKVAVNMESAHRTSLAKRLVDIREKKPAPTLKTFLDDHFLPFAESAHKTKPLTLRYYTQGCDMLKKSDLAGLKIDEITNEHAQQFAAINKRMSPSGINRGLRTLRHALRLANEWGKMEKPVRIKLATGEKQRDRVLDDTEIEKYLKACPQPWKDVATIILDEGFRPGEVFRLQWPHVLLNEDGTGLIRIVEGKSKAARRTLPMTPRVYELIAARHVASGEPTEGWLFPNASKTGHFNGDVAKEHHKRALEDSGVEAFVPYTLRHTALTRLGEKAGGDVFVLARIAGHSSITITQRYVHPQADAINRVFQASQFPVGTKLGTVKKLPVGKTEKKKRR